VPISQSEERTPASLLTGGSIGGPSPLPLPGIAYAADDPVNPHVSNKIDNESISILEPVLDLVFNVDIITIEQIMNFCL